MKLQQIKYFLGIVKNDLNVSKTAESFYTSQPGVSRQIKLLEEELNVELFERHGRLLTGITPIGHKILDMASDVADTVKRIKCVADEYANGANGSLILATTHSQARYVLPKTILSFTKMHSSVSLQLKQANPHQVCEMVSEGSVDLAVASEAMDHFSNLITLPCYSWNRVILVKRNHPLIEDMPLTIEKLSKYPLVTYDNGFTGRYQLDKAFKEANIEPKIMLTTLDADIIKAYVKMDLGVGIIASVAYNPNDDSELVSIDASHLFENCVTKIALKKGAVLRGYVYDFIELFAPHITKDVVDSVLNKNYSTHPSDFAETLTIPHIS